MRVSRSAYPIHQSPFYKLRTKRRLAALLGTTEQEMRELLRRQDLYREWNEPTPKGKLRHIENPHPKLKAIQRRVAKLLARIVPPAFLYCPVKTRSYVTNALQHVGNPVIRTLDIRDYFRATSSRRVYWFFHTRMQCSDDVAGILVSLSTVNGHLPTGSPLSPILSYFTHIDMWEAIERLVRNAGCVLTVYMDDVTVSGLRVPGTLMWNVRQQIARCGLDYHKEKHYCRVPAEITGVIVRDELALPHRKHKAIYDARRELAASTDPRAKTELLCRLRGREGQATQIRTSNLAIEPQRSA